ncbi:MAG: hypothetical protein LBR53_05230 [Deltaproteobacteria bacterium]|jgi:hypothetical protein|nr:hypothetical protein [Deltaproteobacteria bacterium]
MEIFFSSVLVQRRIGSLALILEMGGDWPLAIVSESTKGKKRCKHSGAIAAPLYFFIKRRAGRDFWSLN